MRENEDAALVIGICLTTIISSLNERIKSSERCLQQYGGYVAQSPL